MDAEYRQGFHDGVRGRDAIIFAKECFDNALLASLSHLYGDAVVDKLQAQHVIACATIDRAWDMIINPEKYEFLPDEQK